MKPMWFGSFQIVHVETFGSGPSSGLGAAPVDGAAPWLEPPEPLEPPDPVAPLRRSFGKEEPELDAVWRNEACCEPKIEWSRSESLEWAWSGGGATPYFGTYAPE